MRTENGTQPCNVDANAEAGLSSGATGTLPPVSKEGFAVRKSPSGLRHACLSVGDAFEDIDGYLDDLLGVFLCQILNAGPTCASKHILRCQQDVTVHLWRHAYTFVGAQPSGLL